LPPLWTGRLGVQWLYRLLQDPRRLAVRYLVEPWSLIGGMARDLVRPSRPPAPVSEAA
jgi:N-acetylglucosaminyldiphosphoundecaprenol N-acetyl-beta-D-mannosaminyltransferase